jgi:hypothetical protein
MWMRRVIFLTSPELKFLGQLANCLGPRVQIEPVYDLETLVSAPVDHNTSLISFGSGVIVPTDVLARFSKPAYNIHAASPEFPGRDPHHHAIYRQASTYGATLHVMTASVDAGPIVGVELFSIAARTAPADLLEQANDAGLRLIRLFGAQLLETKPLPALEGVHWGSVKTRRSDLRRYCALTPLITAEEFTRRYEAFDGEKYDNLTVDLHGRTFRIDKRNPSPPQDLARFADFTEDSFRALIQALKSGGYRFAGYRETITERHVLWRHDVDFSMHRAARLAAIEAEEGVVATYFINPHSAFYNLLEPEISRLAARIRDLGHEIGMHFDAGAFQVPIWKRPELEHALARERALLENMLDARIYCVSWHNPDLSNLLDFDADEIAGLMSAYGATLRRDYSYCSDSNGYWRFRPMADVIAEGLPRLHLLTHPEWWTPEPMAPSARIDRAILGRARAVRRNYDTLLAAGGRKNVSQ